MAKSFCQLLAIGLPFTTLSLYAYNKMERKGVGDITRDGFRIKNRGLFGGLRWWKKAEKGWGDEKKIKTGKRERRPRKFKLIDSTERETFLFISFIVMIEGINFYAKTLPLNRMLADGERQRNQQKLISFQNTATFFVLSPPLPIFIPCCFLFIYFIPIIIFRSANHDSLLNFEPIVYLN